jgi:para-nitrobenzyl esterase
MLFRHYLTFRKSLVLFSLLVFSVVAQEQNFSLPNTVTIQSGQIEGTIVAPEVQAFWGIPYAAPPVRELRWRDPQPVKSWSGIYHADDFAPQCMQPQRGILTNQYSGSEVTSEDCLYLNVWTHNGLKKAPVIVFIHGGGFFVGAGSMPLYGGKTVAEHGAVFVNFNYRLGPLGFLAHPELSSESTHGSSGNFGFLDQIAALRWVRDNIDQFGGDPSNVTIVGQSAGSMSVLVLQSSPLAKGLFHRAIGMSGAMLAAEGPFKMRPLDVAEKDGVRLQNIWKMNSLAELRALPADRLIVPRTPDSPPVGPIIDGYVVPDSSNNIFAKSAQNDVPLLLGFTRDESFGGIGQVKGLADYKQGAAKLYGERTAEFLKLYPASNDQEAIAQANASDRDNTMATAMNSWARAQIQFGHAPVYSYMFARPHSYPDGVTITNLDPASAGAYHTSEVPFWLGTLESFNLFRNTREWTQEDRQFSNAMLNSLLAFARTGSPNTDKLNWVRFDPKKPQLLELGNAAKLEPWPDESKLEFFRQP